MCIALSTNKHKELTLYWQPSATIFLWNDLIEHKLTILNNVHNIIQNLEIYARNVEKTVHTYKVVLHTRIEHVSETVSA